MCGKGVAEGMWGDVCCGRGYIREPNECMFFRCAGSIVLGGSGRGIGQGVFFLEGAARQVLGYGSFSLA